MSAESESGDERTFIGPIDVQHKGLKFTLRWDELSYKGHSCNLNYLSEYLPQDPIRTKAGKIAARQPPPPPKQPHAWWQAQALFRGLSHKGTIAELQNALKGHERDGVTAEFRDLEKRATKEWKRKNKAAGKVADAERARALDEKWKGGGMSDGEKLEADGKRYLQEKFTPNCPRGLTISVSEYDNYCIANCARQLGLICEITECPDVGNSVCTKYVIGKDAKLVKRRIEKLQAQGQKRKRDDEEKLKEMERAKKRKIEQTLAKCKDWDVTGKWVIECPYIEQNWGCAEGEKFTLEIYQEKNANGPQMYGMFNFGIISGVLRFERQDGEERLPYDGPPKDDEEDDSCEASGIINKYAVYNDYDDRDRKSPTPDAFYLGKTSEVSAKHPTWKYRWRGNEEGEDVIDLRSTEHIYSLTFCGPRGFTLKGTFSCEIMSEVATITGEKVDVLQTKTIDVREEWAERNESAYDEACHRRWSRW